MIFYFGFNLVIVATFENLEELYLRTCFSFDFLCFLQKSDTIN